ncbi:MAG: DUF192 domain-containing protein [Parcubacteria group bacterium]
MTKKEKFFLFLAIVAVLAVGLAADIFWVKIVRIDGRNFIAETPKRPAEYQKGLGGRRTLCRSCAMLFTFPQKGEYAFWMKDMRFDLDIIWISSGKIVYIEKNFSAHSPEIVRPAVPADRVLEIGAGISEKNGFRVGDSVTVY